MDDLNTTPTFDEFGQADQPDQPDQTSPNLSLIAELLEKEKTSLIYQPHADSATCTGCRHGDAPCETDIDVVVTRVPHTHIGKSTSGNQVGRSKA